MNSLALLLMSSTIYAVSSDCPNVIQLAFGLKVDIHLPAIWTALQGDCCTAYGIYCDDSQRVTEISWWNNGLNGFINGSAIPSGVILLGLGSNSLTGNIPSILPSGLRELYLEGSRMSGDLPSFPSTLTHLALGWSGLPGNQFTGTLRLNRPIELHINHNWITDVVILDSSQINPSWCDLSNNPLLGNPNIANLTTCTQDGMYSAALLPVTMSTEATVVRTTTEVVTTTKTVARTTTSSPESRTSGLGAATTSVMVSTVTGMLNETHTVNLVWISTAVGTVAFVQEMREFTINLGMIIRCIISTMILTYVMSRTPFMRELRRKMNKGKSKTRTGISD